MAESRHFLSDMARLAGGAVSLAVTIRRQVKADLRERLRGVIADAAPDDATEMDRLHASLAKYRQEQDAMKNRIDELETRLSEKTAPPKKSGRVAVKKKRA